ncbi:YihY/virulence factor BrkB family protein [Paracoccus suum]|uniref:YihY/virulence factor BrkB family protein n=1 Tax=Paracoccus suum TaxID=2259340 RepID=UPI0013B04ABF|nr:YihY/virulence factor BrkB family protein [Paracoccus suum]
MPRREQSVTDALFGDLTPETRARFGLATTAPDTAAEPPPRAHRGSASAHSLRELDRSAWWAIAKRVAHQFSVDRITSVSAGVTFFGLLALFPALTALVSIYGLFADRSTIAENMNTLDRFMPRGASELIAGQINAIVSAPSEALGLATILGLLTALWSANGGMKALLSALNIAWFQKEERGLIKLNLVSLGFTLGGIILVGAMIAAIAVLPNVIKFMPVGDFGGTLASVIRWPLMFVVLMLSLAALYRWGPDKRDARWQWISPGAVFATVGLIVTSMVFSYYAANFADYNKTYGSLGAVVGLMMWLWIAAMVIMVGAEINSEVERQFQMNDGAVPKAAKSED